MVKFTVLMFCVSALTWGCGNTSPTGTTSSDSSKIPTGNAMKEVKGKDSLIALLTTMNATILDCSADVYWKIIKRGEASIPLLIEGLTDTTMTNVYDSCKHNKLNVGEVCYFALEEIAEFPASVVTHIQFDLIENGCWNFYDYLFDNRNNKAYQKLVRDFYNTSNFVHVKFAKNELNACRKQFHIEGKYKWKE